MKNNIKSCRKSLKLTLEKLSNLSKISRTSISYYENGLVIPRLDAAYALANALKVDIYELFPDTGEWKREHGKSDTRSDTANRESI